MVTESTNPPEERSDEPARSKRDAKAAETFWNDIIEQQGAHIAALANAAVAAEDLGMARAAMMNARNIVTRLEELVAFAPRPQ